MKREEEIYQVCMSEPEKESNESVNSLNTGIRDTQICFAQSEEAYIVNLDKVLYFMADDHYTHIFYSNNMTVMIPFGLSQVEEKLINCNFQYKYDFIRLGRKYIVDRRKITQVSTVKQQIKIIDESGVCTSIHIPKPVVKMLLDSYRF